jgi:hypothetical protein
MEIPRTSLCRPALLAVELAISMKPKYPISENPADPTQLTQAELMSGAFRYAKRQGCDIGIETDENGQELLVCHKATCALNGIALSLRTDLETQR